MRHPMSRPRAVAALAAAGALALPSAASAHVTLQPSSATAGGFTRLDVRVPNERDDSATTKVDVQLPAGFAFVSYEPRTGWGVTVRREKLDEPIETEEGFEIDEAVSRITWTGDGRQGKVAPGEFVDFGLSLRMPDGKPGDKLTFKALQTYDDGQIVRWIGPEDAEEPAPTVTLTEPAEGGGHGAPGTATTSAAAAPAAVEDEGGEGVGVTALIVGGLGLVAGLAALAASWRRSRVEA
jgi:periplasmic copper chaperone A